METLDLSTHLGATVVGKTVTLQGATYRVDAPSGVSAETPYVLFNLRTGLSLQCVRFVADGGEPVAPDEAAWGAAVPGGRAVLTSNPGPHEADAPWTPAFWEAYRVRAEGKLVEAEALIRSVIALQPAHVLALNHLAGTLMEQGRQADAFPVAAAIVALEPNFPGFAINYVQLTAQLSVPAARLLIPGCRAAFSPNSALDALSARILLELGEPAAAAALLDESHDGALAPLRAEAATWCAAHDRAAPLIQEAERLLVAGTTEGVLELFERAYAAHPHDPYTLANLALALARAGRHEEAARGLLRARLRLPQRLLTLCAANAAFALVDAGHLKEAAAMLEGGVAHLLDEAEESAALLAELPSIAVFVCPPGVSAERLPMEALRRLERLAAGLHGATPATVVRLLALYRRASDATTAS